MMSSPLKQRCRMNRAREICGVYVTTITSASGIARLAGAVPALHPRCWWIWHETVHLEARVWRIAGLCQPLVLGPGI